MCEWIADHEVWKRATSAEKLYELFEAAFPQIPWKEVMAHTIHVLHPVCHVIPHSLFEPMSHCTGVK